MKKREIVICKDPSVYWSGRVIYLTPEGWALYAKLAGLPAPTFTKYDESGRIVLGSYTADEYSKYLKSPRPWWYLLQPNNFPIPERDDPYLVKAVKRNGECKKSRIAIASVPFDMKWEIEKHFGFSEVVVEKHKSFEGVQV